MAISPQERAAAERAREDAAQERWRKHRAKRLQREKKEAEQEAARETRRNIVVGALLRTDPSPEARALLDGYVASLAHPQDARLFGRVPAQPEPDASSSDIDVVAGQGAALGASGEASDLVDLPPPASDAELSDCEASPNILATERVRIVRLIARART